MNIPMPQVPLHEETLPISGIKVQFRPFLVKEEKIFLLANEGENNSDEIINALIQVLTGCTLGKVDIKALPLADTEYLFVQVRKHSVSEIVDGSITCGACDLKFDYGIDLNKVKVSGQIKDKNVYVSDNTIITMKYPTITTALGVDKWEGDDIPLAVVSKMVEMITIDDVVYDAADFTQKEMMIWLENLSKKQVDKVGEFLGNLPKIVYDDNVTCKCGNHIDIHMEGLESFFD